MLIPYRTCDFQGESGPPVTPTSSLGPCMIDPSQNDCVSCLNHELSLVCIALIFLLQKYRIRSPICMRIFRNVTQLETVLKEKSHWALAMR